MPIKQPTNTSVTCDNPGCPAAGGDAAKLPPGLTFDDLAGWIVVTSERYGKSATVQHVVCSPSCFVGLAEQAAAGALEL